MSHVHVTYEQRAAAAFDKQSTVFDEIYSGNKIIEYKRKRVREHVERLMKAPSNILELNAGTGEDSIYFARQDHNVHATDISAGMQKKLCQKILAAGLQHKITTEICSFTELNSLQYKGPYDLVFSNFAGLNCTGNLDKVLASLGPLLRQHGLITLVILPKFCLTESLLVFRGKWKTAFRRFFSNGGRTAHIEGEFFRCWYYNPAFISRRLKNEFDLVSLEGLCSFVPPSYFENFAEKHPRLFSILKKWEGRWKSTWPWRSIGDYYVITLRKK